jgi:hypothetical protein
VQCHCLSVLTALWSTDEELLVYGGVGEQLGNVPPKPSSLPIYRLSCPGQWIPVTGQTWPCLFSDTTRMRLVFGW